MKNIFEQLTDLLKKDERLVSQDGVLLKNQTQELARKNDPALIKLLLFDLAIKKHFFFEVEKTLIFDKEKFIRFVSNKQFLPDSYTAFKNKIGLTVGDEYLSESKEVVLTWPYKDCVLEGGMTKEDQKRDEIFYNETLAPDDINRLLDAKVFTNFKRIDKKGEHKLDGFKRDEKGTIKDNLIIKGNNLLALASLKKQFAGKVKLIYIDPPYNTGSDSFGYNDSFNRSTWFTFMKNRLEEAKKLLAKDGIIAVQCSFHQQAYLKVLMDEMFQKFLVTFNIQVRHPDRILTGDKEYNDVMEYILLYSINSDIKIPKKEALKTDEKYIYAIEEIGDCDEIERGGKKVKIFTPDKYRVIEKKPNPILFKKISIRGSIREKNSSGRFFVKYLEALKNKYPAGTLFRVSNMGDDAFIDRYFYSPPEGNINGGYYQGKPQSSDTTYTPYPNFFNFEKEYNRVAEQGDVDFRNGKKPEELLRFLVDLFTSKGSIVLDYHLGSGTSATVCHKIGCQYIGIEQLNYGENDSVVRLINVINGDQTGISKGVKWKDGGDFVYMELAKWNAEWVEKIEKAKTGKEFTKLWDEMKGAAFLSYKINPKTIDANAKEFADLSIADQKKFLIECLDKNQLYVNLSEIEDKDYQASKEDIKLNKEFYG